MTLNCRGTLVDLTTPKVMAIVNATPDSFFEQSRVKSIDQFKKKIDQMITEGADIIDIGAYSSRPNAEHISEEQELNRLLPLIDFIRTYFPDVLVSVDTYRAEVAKEVLERGVHMINDISGGQLDEQLLRVVSRYRVPYILMHMRGTPQTMMKNTTYDHLSSDLIHYFNTNISKAKQAGIIDIIIDPGFGFSKTLEQNYQLLNQVEQLNALDTPMLIGVSRKSMIYKALDITPNEALNGTTALHMIALSKGAQLLRVHDVKPAVECIKLYQLLKNS